MFGELVVYDLTTGQIIAHEQPTEAGYSSAYTSIEAAIRQGHAVGDKGFTDSMARIRDYADAKGWPRW